MELPLFPIGEIALLPGMALPIFVFEPRYRELLGRIRSTGEVFGIPCVLSSDPNKLIEERLAHVGTFAHLSEVAYNPDGTASIIVIGGERYRIKKIDSGKYPYAVADSEPYPLEDANPSWVHALAREVTERFLARVASRLGDVRHEAPSDPLLLASFITANLRLPGVEQQRVLETKNLLERFELLSELVGIDKRQLN